jgi:flavin reductase (DIM6/NTAB) family NADH-FMN oxidoreductase RutF
MQDDGQRSQPDWAVNVAALDSQEAYHLLTGLILPRPIAWVSTVSQDGCANLAPFGYFNMCSHHPPVLHITDSGSHTDTLRNIRATGEFVCNIVSHDLVEAMNFTAVPFPPEEDEFAWAGVTPAASATVAAPRVAEARASLECRVRAYVSVGEDTMVLGDILHARVAGEVIAGGRVDPWRLAPVCRFGGNRYAEFTRMYKLPRPSWPEIAARGRDARLPPYRPHVWKGMDSPAAEATPVTP